jgi:hypothetical protein
MPEQPTAKWVGTFLASILLTSEGYQGTDNWKRWYAAIVERIKNHTYFIRRHKTILHDGGYDNTMVEVWRGGKLQD